MCPIESIAASTAAMMERRGLSSSMDECPETLTDPGALKDFSTRERPVVWGHAKVFRGVPHQHVGKSTQSWICRHVCVRCLAVNVRLGCGGEQRRMVFVLPPAIEAHDGKTQRLESVGSAQSALKVLVSTSRNRHLAC